jgi:hypothetical protein
MCVFKAFNRDDINFESNQPKRNDKNAVNTQPPSFGSNLNPPPGQIKDSGKRTLYSISSFGKF